MHAQVKRLAFRLAVDERQRAVRDRVRQVARLLDQFPVPDHRRAVIRTSALLVSVPVAESMLGHDAVAQMPLAAQPAGVAMLGQHLSVAGLAVEVTDRIDPLPAHVAALEPVTHSMLRRNPAGQQRGARRRAHRRRVEEPVESGSAGGQPIQVRSANLRVPGKAHRPRPLVVGEDHNDVGPITRRAGSIGLGVHACAKERPPSSGESRVEGKSPAATRRSPLRYRPRRTPRTPACRRYPPIARSRQAPGRSRPRPRYGA